MNGWRWRTADNKNVEPMPVLVNFRKVNAGDWVVFDCRGVTPLSAYTFTSSTEGYVNRPDVALYGYATINQVGTTSKSTSIKVTAATVIRRVPFYAFTGGNEILEVIQETSNTAATSTWTVRRGCLGTTATATGLGNEEAVSILNILYFTTDTTGYESMLILPLPDDGKTECFK